VRHLPLPLVPRGWRFCVRSNPASPIFPSRLPGVACTELELAGGIVMFAALDPDQAPNAHSSAQVALQAKFALQAIFGQRVMHLRTIEFDSL